MYFFNCHPNIQYVRQFSFCLYFNLSLHIPDEPQNYGALNSLSRRAMVIYLQGSKGFYYRSSEQMLNEVSGIQKQYAFDKKAQTLYVLTANANIAITLDKDCAKIIKKNKAIPQLKGDELNKLIADYSKQLDDKFTRLNERRRLFIQDSLAKVRKDSIERVRRHEQYLAQVKKEADEYRNTHDWRRVPTNNVSLECTICDESFSDDTTNCIGIKNDSIYFYTIKREDLGLNLLSTHQAKIPEDLASNKDFQYHYKVFRDSLTNDTVDYNDVVNYLGLEYINRYYCCPVKLKMSCKSSPKPSKHRHRGLFFEKQAPPNQKEKVLVAL